jgi:hypothetical protein
LRINDALERRLRLYISKQYPERPYGKVTEVLESALKEYLKAHSYAKETLEIQREVSGNSVL